MDKKYKKQSAIENFINSNYLIKISGNLSYVYKGIMLITMWNKLYNEHIWSIKFK